MFVPVVVMTVVLVYVGIVDVALKDKVGICRNEEQKGVADGIACKDLTT